jgi:hypothetical protein
MNSSPPDQEKQVEKEEVVQKFLSYVFGTFFCIGLGLSGYVLSTAQPEHLFGLGKLLSLLMILVGAVLARLAAANLVMIINFKH